MELKTSKNYAFISMLKKYVSSSMLLVIATVAALIVANSPWGDTYRHIWEMPVSLSVGGFNLFSHGGHAMSLGDFISDFLMAIFFLSVGLEIKREVLCGELSSVKKALAPIIGACGGMLVPVIVFYMVFLAALAVADDLGGIIVIAIRYTDHLNWQFLDGAALCVIILALCNWRQVRSKSLYMTVGLALWYCMLNSGIHATIAGVVLAFCIPANLPRGTKFYVARIRRNLAQFPATETTIADRNKPVVLSDDEIHMLKSVESASDHLISPLQDLEDSLKNPINYFVIPLFAFANAGVNLAGMSIASLFSGVGLSVFLGLLVGKFCGVFSATWLFIKLHVIQKPEGATWASFASVCMICGIGFTVSMFMAGLSYPAEHADLLNDAKLGILMGTIASAIVGSLMLNATLPKEQPDVTTAGGE